MVRAAMPLMMLASCSWAFVDKVPASALPSPQLRCDDDSRWPLVDGTIALASYGAFITGLAALPYADDVPLAVGIPLVIGTLLALPVGFAFAVASSSGEHRVERCALMRRGYAP